MADGEVGAAAAPVPAEAAPGDEGLASEVRFFSPGDGWPDGYVYGATRYADVILRHHFPERFEELTHSLSDFRPSLDELRRGGGGRTKFVKRFDESLEAQKAHGDIWRKRNIEIVKSIAVDGLEHKQSRTRDHEIDMFGIGTVEEPIPGIAVEMEWNNKDPFYDRDLVSFQALYQEGAIALGVIVTRGPALQEVISGTIRSSAGGYKYGTSTTHWNKLIPRVTLGGGGGCPLILIGIEPPRIQGIELAFDVRRALDEAETLKAGWRTLGFTRWNEAKPEYDRLREHAKTIMPPLQDDPDDAAV